MKKDVVKRTAGGGWTLEKIREEKRKEEKKEREKGDKNGYRDR